MTNPMIKTRKFDNHEEGLYLSYRILRFDMDILKKLR